MESISGGCFRAESNLPSRPLRSHARAPEQTRKAVSSFPGACYAAARTHPNTYDGGEQPDRAPAPIRFGQQYNEYKAHHCRPITHVLDGT
eukprot:12411106-Karenia_brevis.AAC.1